VALELAWSGAVPLRAGLVLIGGAHVLVGLGEGALTAGILSFVWRSRPELLASLPDVTSASRRWAYGLTAAAALVAVASTVAASASPDVLQKVAARFGLQASPLAAAPFAGYAHAALAPWLVALAGVAAVFGLGYLLLRWAGSR